MQNNSGVGYGNQLAQQQAQLDAMKASQKSFMEGLNGKVIATNTGLTKTLGGLNRYGQKRADYTQMRGADGKLAPQFQQTLGSAGQNLLDQGLAKGDTPWATAQRAMISNQQNQAMGNAAQQNAQQQAQARMMGGMRGGVGSGALQNMQNSGNRNLMGAQQNIGFQAGRANLITSQQNQQMKNGLLQGLVGTQQNIQAGNINRLATDVQNQNTFNQNNYANDMKAYGAIQSAKAQNQGSSGSSSCCFIFLEARYGDGTMDEVVRKFRDEKMSPRNRRGYYKLAEVLVPLMRKSKVAKLLVRTCLTDPLVSYGKYYYGKGKVGKMFTPVTKFWLRAFDFFGGEFPFLRENGEVV